jgi:hypothetical protein
VIKGLVVVVVVPIIYCFHLFAKEAAACFCASVHASTALKAEI